MTSFGQDLKSAFRMLGRTPSFTAIAMVVIGLGIGANTATFSLIHELLLRPLPGREDGRLTGLYSRDRDRPDSWQLFSYPAYTDIRDRSDLFDALAAHTFTLVGLGGGTGTSRALASVVSANYFTALGATLAAGRPFTETEEQPGALRRVAIVSHARWRRERFDPATVGRTIIVNGSEFTIVGIAPEGFTGTMALLSPEVYLPLGVFEAVVGDRFKNNGRGLGDRSNRGLSLVGRLRTGLSDDVVTARLEALSRQIETEHPVDARGLIVSAHPLARLSAAPSPQSDGALTAFTSLLMGLSGVVLVIACLNVANMLLARGTSRRKELAVRLALGARRARLIRQLLTEGLVLAAGGALLGWMLSAWATAAFASALSSALPFGVRFGARPDATTLAVTCALVIVATLAFALGPALTLSRRDPASDLMERGDEPARRRGLFAGRNMLVVGQVALSLALLTAGGIFVRSTVRAADRGPGYAYDRLLVAQVDTQLAGLDEARGRAAFGELLRRLRALPGIEAAAITSTVPFGDSVDSRAVERIAAAGEPSVSARAFRIVGAEYFRTLDLPLVAGREFTAAEELSPDAPAVAIVDHALARLLFGHTNVLGETIRLASPAGATPAAPGPPMIIVGIAAPLREEVLDPAPVPHVYVPFGRYARAGMHVQARIAPGVDERESLEWVRREIRAVDVRLPVLSLTTMAAFHDQSLDLWGLRAGARTFAALGVVALLLSGLGVYGVMAYLVARRTREIGIRMALGATAADVRRLVARQGLRLTGIGLAIGLPLALLVSQAFQSVFVDIGGADAIVIVIAVTLLATVATAACLVPVRRAVRVEPVRALRGDA